MKKTLLNLFLLILLTLTLTSCKDKEKTIIVGGTPSPHAEILNCEAVQNYIKSKGYTLEVKVYQDWATLNKALNDEGIDANYFQHAKYLNKDIQNYGFNLSAACEVHNEPLNLYGKTKISDFTNKKSTL